MTFREKYLKSEIWHEKAIVMEIYHLAMCQRIKGWTIGNTAQYFNVSIGLVSENLKLALAIHLDPVLIQSPNRQKALKRVNGNVPQRHYVAEDD